MGMSLTRRLGAIAIVVLLLSVLLVPSAAACGPTIHIVQRGETLYRISLRYGVSMAEIARANGIWNYNRIYVGQRLVIPCGWAPPPYQQYYRVRWGDTLAKIAARFGTTVWRLMQLNHLSNPNWIYAGQVLRVRGYAPPPPTPPPTPPLPAGGWHAQYYNSQDLSGAPALERTDANLAFNWGYGSPAPQVFADHFSARWTRTFRMSGGTYRITARTDDGVRVYIDGVKVIDAWIVQPATSYVQDVIIPYGDHTFTVEFFEAEGLAEIQITSHKL